MENRILSRIKSKKEKFRNLYIADSENFINYYLNCNVNLDIIVIDLDEFIKKEDEIDFFKILSINPNQQFIFLAKNRKTYQKFLKNFDGGSSMILFKPIRSSAILDNIILITTKNEPKFLNLNENIKVDLTKEEIYDRNKQIFLTNSNHKLLLLLSRNVDKLTSFSMIDEIVYEGKCHSKISMQNLVGNLKRKLNLDIKNIHSKGYVLQSFNLKDKE
ncbi:helix-turn-helix domain-containing protein [Campylobacter sp. CCUG 57310]|uniref:helix-turn-helix domain-containing protein n=1 Tax=Campylobacter sp. CCUG 57310 TaxID=2517362 RepID=UPI0020B168FF|nr:helix-turn-helix domain-containing protein [Campylobacter sp. CCUG 57310]QKF91411.1 putative transcriptional regulator [Campylobacter sp. CCUG 57310]